MCLVRRARNARCFVTSAERHASKSDASSPLNESHFKDLPLKLTKKLARECRNYVSYLSLARFSSVVRILKMLGRFVFKFVKRIDRVDRYIVLLSFWYRHILKIKSGRFSFFPSIWRDTWRLLLCRSFSGHRLFRHASLALRHTGNCRTSPILEID